MPPRAALFTGTLFALAAGLMWGLVFVAPLMLADYPAALLTFGRYLAFGLIALPLAWLDWARIRELTRADWWETSFTTCCCRRRYSVQAGRCRP